MAAVSSPLIAREVAEMVLETVADEGGLKGGNNSSITEAEAPLTEPKCPRCKVSQREAQCPPNQHREKT